MNRFNANDSVELDNRIYQIGDESIMSVGDLSRSMGTFMLDVFIGPMSEIIWAAKNRQVILTQQMDTGLHIFFRSVSTLFKVDMFRIIKGCTKKKFMIEIRIALN